MINQLLSYDFGKKALSTTHSDSVLLTSLMSRTGDIVKNNDRLKFALVSVRYPEAYEEQLACQGHPTSFLKILHYALFAASPVVRDHIFAQSIDPDTVHLNDLKFLTRVFYILTNMFGYRPKVTIDQFFKYGFAESKMLLCVDTINLVKRKHKYLKVQRSLSSSRRSALVRPSDTGKVSMVSHWQGKSQTFKFERDTTHKVTRNTKENVDIGNTPQRITVVNQSSPLRCSSAGSQRRTSSLEVSQRLLGSIAFQVPNRHSKRAVIAREADKEAAILEKSNSSRPGSALRLRSENKIEEPSTGYLEKPLRQRRVAFDYDKSGQTTTHVSKTNVVQNSSSVVEKSVSSTAQNAMRSEPMLHSHTETVTSQEMPVRKAQVDLWADASLDEQKVHSTYMAKKEQEQQNRGDQFVGFSNKDSTNNHQTTSVSNTQNSSDQMSLLFDSLQKLTGQFQQFSTNITQKIDNIEHNYHHLADRITAINSDQQHQHTREETQIVKNNTMNMSTGSFGNEELTRFTLPGADTHK